jgi:hypothetical protein
MNELEMLKTKLRKAFGDYKSSEGCSCCEGTEDHEEAAKVIAELLDVEPYSDGSGFDFYRYSTSREGGQDG